MGKAPANIFDGFGPEIIVLLHASVLPPLVCRPSEQSTQNQHAQIRHLDLMHDGSTVILLSTPVRDTVADVEGDLGQHMSRMLCAAHVIADAEAKEEMEEQPLSRI